MQKYASVSVVIPCFRCTNTIRRAVSSVYQQTLRPAELILIDDKSNDATLELLYSIQKEHADGWIKIIELSRNGGPSGARNAGWDAAAQDYVALLDSDDSWHPQKIEIQLSWMRENPNVAITGHDLLVVSNADAPPPEIKNKTFTHKFHPYKISRTWLLLRGKFSTSSVMMRRSLKTRFSLGKYHGEDRLLLLETVFSGEEIYKIPLPLQYAFKETYGAGGLSAQLWKMEKGELDAFLTIFKSGKINKLTLFLVCVFSLIKYTRRLVASSLRKK